MSTAPIKLLLCCSIVILSACGAAEPVNTAASSTPAIALGSCTLALASDGETVTDEGAIAAVLNAESEFVVRQEIEALMRLWASGAYIADAKNTPEDAEDDQRWLDRDAIRHRYVRTVFPGAPASASPKDLVFDISDDQATITATTQIGDEVSPAGDRWTLVKENGCWMITSLTYNLESP